MLDLPEPPFVEAMATVCGTVFLMCVELSASCEIVAFLELRTFTLTHFQLARRKSLSRNSHSSPLSDRARALLEETGPLQLRETHARSRAFADIAGNLRASVRPRINETRVDRQSRFASPAKFPRCMPAEIDARWVN
jgi:hypothetical protein